MHDTERWLMGTVGAAKQPALQPIAMKPADLLSSTQRGCRDAT
jgi:hypothetical protein